MEIQTTIDIARLRELVDDDPQAATDEQLTEACRLIPGASIHLGAHAPGLPDLTAADVTLIGHALSESARRSLDWRTK
ncbi:MAG: hypothetical protein QM598_05750 [Protaetiibacter sp.]